MNIVEHLLTVLGEECGEVAKKVSKGLRFGLGDRNVLDPTGLDNRERIVEEIRDVKCVIELLEELDIIPSTHVYDDHLDRKWKKLGKFLQYAVKTGALDHDVRCYVVEVSHDRHDRAVCDCGLTKALDATGYEGPVPDPAPHKGAK
jgi:NTP pyrophosphatase (non-canonical NTP hydrolase)